MVGVKIWRFRNKVWEFRVGNSNMDQDLLPKSVATFIEPKENDWLIQKAPINKLVTKIPKDEIIVTLSDVTMPKDGDIWQWDGKKLTQIYSRSTPINLAERQQAVTALLELENPDKEEAVVVYRGEGMTSLVYHAATKELDDKAEVEVISETLATKHPGNEDEGIFEPDETTLLWLTHHLWKKQKKIEAAIQAAKQNKAVESFKLVRSIVLDLVEGAEPAPVQGHNVLHSVPGVINSIEQLDALVRQGRSLAQVSDSNRSSATGDIGAGVGLVDITWQSMGSLVAFFRSVAATKELKGKKKEELDAQFGKNAKIRHGVSVATHASKATATTASAIEAIGNIAAFATHVPAQLVPGIGAATMLISLCRSSTKAHKARVRLMKLNRILKSKKNKPIDPHVQALLAYAMRKTKRKFATQTATATTAAAGSVSSSILLVGAIAAGANAWNPVGWGIGVATFVAGMGLLGYKIFRKVTSKKRAMKRGFTREKYPEKLLEAYVNWMKKKKDSHETHVLKQILHAYGVQPTSLFLKKGFALAKDRIARHLEA